MLNKQDRDGVIDEMSRLHNGRELFIAMAMEASTSNLFQYGTPELDLAARHAAQETLLRVAKMLE